jgi:predicted double-glycine peptidase
VIDGHYMVVIGIDNEIVYFEDPQYWEAEDTFHARNSWIDGMMNKMIQIRAKLKRHTILV